jgi:uncharacterized membrane protein YeiH
VNTLDVLDFVGVGLFAATGALTASRKQLDIIGFLFMATITGVGGGTVRDLILNVPVFWVEKHFHVLTCMGTAVFVYFGAHLIESRYRLLLWLDALALAAYGVFGAFKGLTVTGSPVVAVVMGTMTGTLGGILRDVIAGEPSVIMRKEVYISAAMTGALLFVVADALGVPLLGAVWVSFLVAFGIRGGALALGWSLPRYRPRPGRRSEDL